MSTQLRIAGLFVFLAIVACFALLAANVFDRNPRDNIFPKSH